MQAVLHRGRVASLCRPVAVRAGVARRPRLMVNAHSKPSKAQVAVVSPSWTFDGIKAFTMAHARPEQPVSRMQGPPITITIKRVWPISSQQQPCWPRSCSHGACYVLMSRAHPRYPLLFGPNTYRKLMMVVLCILASAFPLPSFLNQQEQADPQESPYFDSLCRSFLLGVGAGALVETVHMLSKLVQTPDVAGEGSA